MGYGRFPTGAAWIGIALGIALGGEASFDGSPAAAVIATVETEADLDWQLRDWEHAMSEAHRVAWLLRQLR